MDTFLNLLHNELNVARRNVDFSHLIYAKVLLVFEKAETYHANKLIFALKIFEGVSNLDIKASKSSICFSKSVSAILQTQLCHAYGFSNVPLP